MGCNGGRVVREPPLRGIAVVARGVMGSRRRGNNGGGWEWSLGVAEGWCGESKTGAHEGRPYGGLGLRKAPGGFKPAPTGMAGVGGGMGSRLRGNNGRGRGYDGGE